MVKSFSENLISFTLISTVKKKNRSSCYGPFSFALFLLVDFEKNVLDWYATPCPSSSSLYIPPCCYFFFTVQQNFNRKAFTKSRFSSRKGFTATLFFQPLKNNAPRKDVVNFHHTP